jgi:hypothetical protein
VLYFGSLFGMKTCKRGSEERSGVLGNEICGRKERAPVLPRASSSTPGGIAKGWSCDVG